MARRNSGGSDGAGSCLVLLAGILIAMPVLGIYLLTKGNDDDKAVGLILLVLGILIWGYVLIQSL